MSNGTAKNHHSACRRMRRGDVVMLWVVVKVIGAAILLFGLALCVVLYAYSVQDISDPEPR